MSRLKQKWILYLLVPNEELGRDILVILENTFELVPNQLIVWFILIGEVLDVMENVLDFRYILGNYP